jgi:hypothetical protein
MNISALQPTVVSANTYKETNVSLIQDLRAEVDIELLAQTGLYNPEDKETNVRIINDIRASLCNMRANIAPEAKHIAEVAIATNENLQIRDFLMGINTEASDTTFSPEDVYEYLLLIGTTVNKNIAVPVATVFAAHLYERDKADAKNAIQEVLSVNPEYSLANLLNRVFNADIDADFLKVMASDLHSQVLNIIYEKETDDDSNRSAK